MTRFTKPIRVLFLLLLFAQLILSARLKSPTIDEPNHLTRGYAYLKTGDLRLSRAEGHPPLINALCALPLLTVKGLKFPDYLQSWQASFRNAFAIELVFGSDVPIQKLFFMARLPVMLITMCLAALMARWAHELYGVWGSVIALTFCVFDPNLIAHGRFTTTDMGITFFLCLAVYTFWRYLRQPSLWMLVLSGLATGLAQASKFSAIILFPILGLLGLVYALDPNSSLPGVLFRKRSWQVRALATLTVSMGTVVILSGLTVWAIYGFRVGTPSGWSIPTPAPYYVEGLSNTLGHAAQTGHPAFLMGERSVHGWWTYFPIAFAIKTPVPALVALASALVCNLWVRPRRAEWALLLLPVIYFGTSLTSRLNIGYRHLLPMLPFLWIYVGRLGILFRDRALKWTAIPAGVLGIWLVAGTLSIAPDYLTFFNLLAGGPDGGWRYLVDSNLDWGQELPAIAEYASEHDDKPLHLSWFGGTYPHLYGLDLNYRLLPSHFSYPYPSDAARSAYNPLHPAPGWYAIGATNLQASGLAAGDVFAPFRELDPVARLGHSVLVYEIPEDTAPSQPTCISGYRFKDLDAETQQMSYGRGPGAIKWFGHETSFVLPSVQDVTYVLPSLPLSFAPDWQAAFVTEGEVVHIQTRGERYPEATVYGLDAVGMEHLRKQILDDAAEPAYWSLETAFGPGAEIYPCALPVEFGYGIEFVGYRLLTGPDVSPGQTIELVTVWRSQGLVPAAASDLRSFVHLLSAEGQLWAGEDRLDLHPPTWEAGDVLVQYHRLAVPADMPLGEAQIEIGLYRAITFDRLSARVGEMQSVDRLLLQTIEGLQP